MRPTTAFCSFLRKYHFSQKNCLARKYLDLIRDKKDYNKKKQKIFSSPEFVFFLRRIFLRGNKIRR